MKNQMMINSNLRDKLHSAYMRQYRIIGIHQRFDNQDAIGYYSAIADGLRFAFRHTMQFGQTMPIDVEAIRAECNFAKGRFSLDKSMHNAGYINGLETALEILSIN